MTTLSPEGLDASGFCGQMGLTNEKSTHYIAFDVDKSKLKRADPQNGVKRLYLAEDVRIRDENNKQRRDVKHGKCMKKK